MKIIIAGRSGSGKTYLAGILASRGLKLLRTSTTRPCRGPDDTHYEFLTKEQAAAVPETDKLFPTVLNGYEYFATREAIEQADIMILDPVGVRGVVSAFPDTAFFIVNMIAADQDKARELACSRAADPKAERRIYDARRKAEEPAFAAFDAGLDFEGRPDSMFPRDALKRNCQNIIDYENDFDPETMARFADAIGLHWNAHQNLRSILAGCAARHVLPTGIPGTVPVAVPSGGTPTDRSFDVAADILLADAEETPNAMSEVMFRWLATLTPDENQKGDTIRHA